MKAVIFDMDGVVVDTNPFHRKAWEAFYEKHGLVYDDSEFNERFLGRNNREILPALLGEMSDDEVEKLSEEKEELFRSLFDGSIVSGVKEFIATLRTEGVKVGLATSAPRSNTAYILDLLQVDFDCVLDGADVARAKPDPEIYLKSAEKLGVDPKDCVVFEDSFAGIASGKGAGMEVIGVATTHSVSELQEKVDRVITDFTEITVQDVGGAKALNSSK